MKNWNTESTRTRDCRGVATKISGILGVRAEENSKHDSYRIVSYGGARAAPRTGNAGSSGLIIARVHLVRCNWKIQAGISFSEKAVSTLFRKTSYISTFSYLALFLIG